MKLLRTALWLLPALVLAEELPQIEKAPSLPTETTTQAVERAPAPAMSTSERDLQDKRWLFYENRVVKIRVRVKSEWSMMELREANDVGTVSFTLSRLPRVTFAVVRAPLEGRFETYVNTEALTPLYPTIQKKTSSTLAGRKGVLIKGIAEDGRTDESHFSSDGKSFYRVSFSAPQDAWAQAEEDFNAIKRGLRWLN